MGVPKALDDLRQPVHGNAGVGRHADGLLPTGVDAADLPLQRLAGAQQLLYHGEHPLPRRREPDARSAAHQQGKADVLFQTVHHMGQPRLGVPQRFCRSGKAAHVHGHGQRLQLFRVHTPPSFSMKLCHVPCYTAFFFKLQWLLQHFSAVSIYP